MKKIIGFLLFITLVINVNASDRVDGFTDKNIENALYGYNRMLNMLGKRDIRIVYRKSKYNNRHKTKIKVDFEWETRKGSKRETVLLKRDSFSEYIGYINSSRARGTKSGFEIVARTQDAKKVDLDTKITLKNTITK